MIVIIGAGLTGLSAAYHLERHGISDIVICEKHATPGGLLRTARVDGFTFDHTGHFLHVNDSYFADFLATICDLDSFDRIHRRSSVYTHGRINPYPFQMNLYGLPAHVITQCITGYINRPRIARPQTFRQWVQAHFGNGIGTHFFFPFQQKILSYDLRKIEPSWTGRFVPRTDLSTMIHNAVTPPQPEQKVGYNSNLIYPAQGGIDTVITNLRNTLTTPILTEHDVVAIDAQKKTISFANGTTLRYSTLITTMPLNTFLHRMAPQSNYSVADYAARLRCNSVLNINLGINRPIDLDVHWLYVPDAHLPFYRLGFWHNICAALAPKNHSSLYAELSFLPGRDSTALVAAKREQSITQICELLGITRRDIILEHDLTLHHAYVIYDQWRKKNLKKILHTLQNQNIHSIGRFGEWKYSSMQEAVLDGRSIADTLAPHYNSTQHRATHKSVTHYPVSSRTHEHNA